MDTRIVEKQLIPGLEPVGEEHEDEHVDDHEDGEHEELGDLDKRLKLV